MTAAAELIADEIRESGPLPFSRFMELALYHPEVGYYTRKDRFGKAGDFYTAEQLQPVFGRLVAGYLRQVAAECEFTATALAELGAGRQEMAQAFKAYDYIPIEIGAGKMPRSFRGVVFSNELFDALPVDVVQGTASGTVERRVDFQYGRFVWVNGPAFETSLQVPLGEIREVQISRLKRLQEIDSNLEEGLIVTIDYGYTRRELVRFPQGTLMSYRRHNAIDDVLSDPGEQDITAHVDFDALQDEAERLGWINVRYESLAQAMLRAGEPDHFAEAIEAPTETGRVRNRLQLKTLLFGLGETFRVLVQRKAGQK